MDVSRVPGWVAPPPVAVRDELLLALAAAEDYRDDLAELTYASTVATTCSWVLGTGGGPLSHTRTPPARRELVIAELRTPVHESMTPARSAAHDTCMWLLGPLPGDTTAPAPPYEVPGRGSDGQILSAEQLFTAVVVDSPDTRTTVQWRQTLAEIEDAVERWHRTDGLIDRTARRVTAQHPPRSA